MSSNTRRESHNGILTSSAYEEAPVQASKPDPSQTSNEAPTLPQCAVTIP